MAIEFQETLDLLPDIYDKSIDSNIFKIIQVFTEELSQLCDVFNDIAGLEDISNVFGATLDLLGKDFNLVRGGKSDEDFRALIFAKQSNFLDGNTINAVINYFSFFTDINDIVLVERFIESLGTKLDATYLLDASKLLSGIGVRRSRSFDVETGVISPSLEIALTEALQILKAGGVEATVNSL